LLTLAFQRLGVANLLPSSSTLVDSGSSDDPNFVDIDQMLALSTAMIGARAALAADAAAAVDKLHERLTFFAARRANATAWVDELIALLRAAPSKQVSASTTTPAETESTTLFGLATADFKRMRALLFYRNCEFSLRLLRALIERIGKATRTNPPTNDLKMEFWATVSSLRCCTEPLAQTPLSDELREQGVALIRLVAIRRSACGLHTTQATRLFDWLKQGELAGVVRPETAAPPVAKPSVVKKPAPFKQDAGYKKDVPASKVTPFAGQKRGWNGGAGASKAAAASSSASASTAQPELTPKQKRQQQKNKKRQKSKQARAAAAAAATTTTDEK
jgi:hypothetical protein